MASGSSGSELLEDLLTCQICYERYNTPKGLPCHHTFCQECLSSYIQTSGAGLWRRFKCPICRTDVSVPAAGVQAFPNDFKVQQLLDVRTADLQKTKFVCEPCEQNQKTSAADYHCYDCNMNFCQVCTMDHKSFEITRNHRIENIATTKFECNVHNGMKVEYFCTDCTLPLCYHCYAKNHKKCQVVIIGKNYSLIYACLLREKEQLRQADEGSIVSEINELDVIINQLRCEGRPRKTIEALTRKRLDLNLLIENEDNELNDRINQTDMDVVPIVEQDIQLKLTQGCKPSLKGYIPLNIGKPTSKPSTIGCFPDSTSIIYAVDNKVVISLVESEFEDCQTITIRPPNNQNDEVSIVSINVLTDKSFLVTYQVKSRLFIEHRDEMGSRIDCYGPLSQSLFSGRQALGWTSAGFLVGGLLAGPVSGLLVGAAALLSSTSSQKMNMKLGHPCGVIIPFGSLKRGGLVIVDTQHPALCFYDNTNFRNMVKHVPLKGLKEPQHAIVVKNTDIYISDASDNSIKVYNMQGALTHRFGETGSDNGQLLQPAGLHSWNEKILVTDYFNHRVSVFTLQGRFLSHVLTSKDGIQYPVAVHIMTDCNQRDSTSIKMVVFESSPSILQYRHSQKMSVFSINSSAI